MNPIMIEKETANHRDEGNQDDEDDGEPAFHSDLGSATRRTRQVRGTRNNRGQFLRFSPDQKLTVPDARSTPS